MILTLVVYGVIMTVLAVLAVLEARHLAKLAWARVWGDLGSLAERQPGRRRRRPVCRPSRSWVFPQDYETLDELAADLTTEGRAILEYERAK